MVAKKQNITYHIPSANSFLTLSAIPSKHTQTAQVPDQHAAGTNMVKGFCPVLKGRKEGTVDTDNMPFECLSQMVTPHNQWARSSSEIYMSISSYC